MIRLMLRCRRWCWRSSVYAWRDWYKALCGLILLMAVDRAPGHAEDAVRHPGTQPVEHAAFRGSPGLALEPSTERLAWDMPRHVTWLLLVYFGVVVVGFLRMMADRAGLEAIQQRASSVSEHLINTIKWVVPGLLLFDGCRTRNSASSSASAHVLGSMCSWPFR